MQQYNNEELYHYGVLGMRWGVRRSEAQLARARNNPSDNKSKDNAITNFFNKPKVKAITDGVIGVVGAKGVFALAGGIASLAGKKHTAQALHKCGDMAMLGGGIVSTVNLLTKHKENNDG